jgi:hypothetical protein
MIDTFYAGEVPREPEQHHSHHPWALYVKALRAHFRNVGRGTTTGDVVVTITAFTGRRGSTTGAASTVKAALVGAVIVDPEQVVQVVVERAPVGADGPGVRVVVVPDA